MIEMRQLKGISRLQIRRIHAMVSKGFLKKRTASRKVSRLNILVNSMQVA